MSHRVGRLFGHSRRPTRRSRGLERALFPDSIAAAEIDRDDGVDRLAPGGVILAHADPAVAAMIDHPVGEPPLPVTRRRHLRTATKLPRNAAGHAFAPGAERLRTEAAPEFRVNPAYLRGARRCRAKPLARAADFITVWLEVRVPPPLLRSSSAGGGRPTLASRSQ